jgi:hypothetical protein
MDNTKVPIRPATEIQWAMLAAYIDGEGHIGILKRHRKQGRWDWQAFDIHVDVCNTDPRLPKWIADTFGGRFAIVYRTSPRAKRILYSWSVWGLRCRQILEGILSYSIIKQEQIKIGLAYLDTVKHGRDKCYRKGRYVPDEVKAQRANLYEQLQLVRAPKDLIQ